MQPTSRAQSNNSSRHPSSSRVNQAHRKSIKNERDSSQRLIAAVKPKVPSKRHTINSITAHEPTLNPKLLPPQADIKIPDPPSRSPTPPTKVIRGANGNIYTQEDKEFFIKFLLWELQKNPNLTKQELCIKLAEKVCSLDATSIMSLPDIVDLRSHLTASTPGNIIGVGIMNLRIRYMPLMRNSHCWNPTPREVL